MNYNAGLEHEFHLRSQGFRLVAGLDEAGRGAWAGPVVAGAVILPLDRFDLANQLSGVDDSKQLAPTMREALLPLILDIALAASVGHASNTEIDQLGIVPATRLAMRRALSALATSPDALLVDALRLPSVTLPQTALIKGDQRSLSIASASILAKVTRDRFMDDLDRVYPHFGFLDHKGYGTSLHRETLQRFGPSPAHRMSFAPIQDLVKSPAQEESNT